MMRKKRCKNKKVLVSRREYYKLLRSNKSFKIALKKYVELFGEWSFAGFTLKHPTKEGHFEDAMWIVGKTWQIKDIKKEKIRKDPYKICAMYGR